MGRRDTARRRLTGAGIPIGPADSKLDLNKNGFPPGTTVDELRWYSRRRNNDRKNDNLYPETGSLKDVTSEYTRCFQAPPLASHSLGDLTDNSNERKRSLRRYSSHLDDMYSKCENDSKWLQRSRRQNLKLEGDMLFNTENADEFIEYVLSKRPDLLRRKTNLRLEGNMNTTTESQEKFKFYQNVERPPLMKRTTNLHLEGEHLYLPEYKELFVEFPRKRPTMTRPSHWLRIDAEGKMNTDTETLSKFVEHIAGKKPDPVKRPSNLKCEGATSFVPEYKENFREYPLSRQLSVRQEPNIKIEGELHANPEYKEKYTTLPPVKIKPIRQIDSMFFEDLTKKTSDPIISSFPNDSIRPARQPDRILFSDEIRKYPEPKPPISLNFPNESGVRPTRQPDRILHTDDIRKNPPISLNLPIESGLNVSADSAGVSAKPPTPPKPSSPGLAKFKNRMEPPKKAPNPARPKNDERITSRPPRSTRQDTWSPSSPSNRKNSQSKERAHNDDDSKEFVPRYNIYGTYKSQPMKQPEVLSNSLECQPEYRKAYLDYLIRERPKKAQDGFDDEHKNKTPEDDFRNDKLRDAEAKLNQTNLSVYQPTTRRGSTHSNHSSPRRRSASPSYKMHVTNVDEPKKGFGARTIPRNARHQNYEHNKREGSLIGYPPQRESVADSNARISTRSNWIRNIAQQNVDDIIPNIQYDTGNVRHNEKPSFVVLDKIEGDVQKLRKKWESPWWQNSY